MLWKPCKAWNLINLMMDFVMSHCEVESLFDGLRWMASRIPGWFWIDVLYEIPHSCLEYGMGVNGWREIWLSHSTVGWNMVVPSPVGSLHSLMANPIPWYSRVKVLMYLWILWLVCLLYSYSYYASYMHILWQQLCMAFNMFLLVCERIMCLWLNGG